MTSREGLMYGSKVVTLGVLVAGFQLLPCQTRAGWFDRKSTADDSSCPSINCGECDHYQRSSQFCRQQCKSTWYPRIAPYCQPGWGWTQPCWRRAEDTYNCPVPAQAPAST